MRFAGAPVSSAQIIARYLIGLRPILVDACKVRNDWVRALGLVISEARSGDAMRVARRAGKLGSDFAPVFRIVRGRIDQLKAPPECDVCHASVRAWTEALIRSCEELDNVGRTNQMTGLRIAQDYLSDGRVQAQRFNDEYARLSRELRQRVAIARQRGAVLPGRRQASPS